MAKVNYIAEHRAFMLWAAANGLSPRERLLWEALFTLFNARAQGDVWPEGYVEIPSYELEENTGLSRDSVGRARADLVRRGLIGYRSGERNVCPASYRMHYLSAYGAPERADEEERGKERRDAERREDVAMRCIASTGDRREDVAMRCIASTGDRREDRRGGACAATSPGACADTSPGAGIAETEPGFMAQNAARGDSGKAGFHGAKCGMPQNAQGLPQNAACNTESVESMGYKRYPNADDEDNIITSEGARAKIDINYTPNRGGVRAAYVSAFGREPTPEEVKALDETGADGSLVAEALRRAAQAAARHPVAYASRLLDSWAGLRDAEELEVTERYTELSRSPNPDIAERARAKLAAWKRERDEQRRRGGWFSLIKSKLGG